MKKQMCDFFASVIVAGILYSGCLAPVQAQNVTCTTRPVGDSSNACASTAFVQGTGFIPGTSAPYFTPGVFGTAYIAQGHVIPWLDEAIAVTNLGVYPFGVNATNPIVLGSSGSTIGSSTVGQTFSVRFTSTALVGSPITITYIAVGGDTTTTIAIALCAAINANTTLHNAITGLPIFCQQISGARFNIQYSAGLQSVGATSLTLASVGTGTINLTSQSDVLDFVAIQWARSGNAQGANTWIPQNGDNLFSFDFTGFSNHAGTGVFDTHYVQTNSSASNVQSGTQIGRWGIATAYNSTSVNGDFYIERGLVGYNSSGIAATGGDMGYSTFNLNGGGIFFNQVAAVQPSTGGAGAAGLISTGAPAAISWENTAGAVDQKWWDSLATGTTLSFRAANDAQSSATNWAVVTRSGTTISSVNFPNGTLQTGGNAVLNAGTPVTAVQGGTGLSTYAVGDLIYASAVTPTLSRLADVATGSVLVSGGIGVAPAWSATPSVSAVNIAAGASPNGLAYGGTNVLETTATGAAGFVFFRDTEGALSFLIGASGDKSTYFNKDNTIFRSTAATEAFHFRNNKVHLEANNAGNGNTPPTTGTCGTGNGTVSGTDFAGEITTGSSATTSCILTFAAAYTGVPYCVATPVAAANSGLFLTPATGTLTFTYTSATSLRIAYHCIARTGG